MSGDARSGGRGVAGPTRAVDDALRLAAFAHVRRLVLLHGELTSDHLATGFQVRGDRVPSVNPQRGIFKPRAMDRLLSIRTVYPRSGAKVWYDDQRKVHAQVYGGSDAVDYAFMGENPDAADNRWLREAYEEGVPILYFPGTSPGRYQALLPTYVVGWDGAGLTASLAFGEALDGADWMTGRSAEAALIARNPPEAASERRYGLTLVKRRLHQASFRTAVLDAYGGRCALSRLPEARLLDAAHIVADGDAALGQPVVPNGVPLSKIHHAAFDAHLIGIDPDYRLHVSDQLMAQNDGPVLEAIKDLRGKSIHLRGRAQDRPDRDRLAQWFELYTAAA